MLTLDEKRILITQLQERLSSAVVDAVTQEFIRLGPDALRVILHTPEILIHPPTRHWVVRCALAMPEEKVVPVLMEALAFPDWRVTQPTCDAIAKLGMKVRDALVENLRTCKVAGGRERTLFCLHRLADPYYHLEIGDESLIPVMAKSARDDESDLVRAQAVLALSRSEAFEAESTVVKALGDPSPAVRKEAMLACGRLRLKSAAPRLVKMLRHKDPEYRADVIYALDRIGDARAAKAVRRMLADKDWYVRWAAVKALERLWEGANVEPLVRAAKDRHALVAIAALETLALKAPEEARPVLAKAVRHKNASIRKAAGYYHARMESLSGRR